MNSPTNPNPEPEPRLYVRLVRAYLREEEDVFETLVRLATVDPDAPVFPGCSVTNATDAKATLSRVAQERFSIDDPDGEEIEAAYYVLAALGRVVASAALPDAVYAPQPEHRLGCDIVHDLDKATDTVREWFGYLYG